MCQGHLRRFVKEIAGWAWDTAAGQDWSAKRDEYASIAKDPDFFFEGT